jgi:hypothetical protein
MISLFSQCLFSRFLLFPTKCLNDGELRSRDVFAPFTREYREPVKATVLKTVCNENNLCVDYFEITAQQTTARLTNSGPETMFYGYDEQIPGWIKT